jgi:hypothetical protein
MFATCFGLLGHLQAHLMLQENSQDCCLEADETNKKGPNVVKNNEMVKTFPYMK